YWRRRIVLDISLRVRPPAAGGSSDLENLKRGEDNYGQNPGVHSRIERRAAFHRMLSRLPHFTRKCALALSGRLLFGVFAHRYLPNLHRPNGVRYCNNSDLTSLHEGETL